VRWDLAGPSADFRTTPYGEGLELLGESTMIRAGELTTFLDTIARTISQELRPHLRT
jgi:hypothetical protein